MSCVRDNEYVMTVLILAGAVLLGCGPTDREPQVDSPVTQGAPGSGSGVTQDGSGDHSGVSGHDSGTATDTGRTQQEPPVGGAELTLYFSRGESVVAVSRQVPAGGGGLEAALRQLVRGPTPRERAAGLHSWFSDTTANALRSVSMADDGRAVVDFDDLRQLIPNASTSAGSGMLLRELNSTVFAILSVRSVEYRIEGSCAQFWEWLQYGGCRVQER